MEVINLTPHDVNVVNADGNITATYVRSGVVARVTTVKEVCGTIARREHDAVGTIIKRVKYGSVENLPEPDGETTYIVSMVVAQACPGRNDLVCPDTAPDAVVRDDNGQIIGVKNFARY